MLRASYNNTDIKLEPIALKPRAKTSIERRALVPSAQPAVDLTDLFDPLVPLTMLESENVVERPVEVVGDVRYLLVQSVRGVAGYSPTDTGCSSGSSSRFISLIFR